MTTAPTIELNNGVAMPLIGLGTYPLDDRQVAETVVTGMCEASTIRAP